ncbi:hypothetical protein HS125_06235 [bacterium]|nr:hypothetical protein [bacterium]
MVDAINSALAGIHSALRRYEQSAARIARAGQEVPADPAVQFPQPEDRFDLSREAVNLLASRHAVAANAAVIRAEDKLLGNLLDILA